MKMKTTYLLLLFVTMNAAALFAQNKPGQKKILETFLDAQNKPLYPVARVYTPTGYWIFNGALVTASQKLDIRPKAPRVLAGNGSSESGFISTDYDIKGLQKIRVGFIGYKVDNGPFAVEVLVSTDKGKTWKSLGSKPGDPAKVEETIAEFTLDNPSKGSYRVKIANASEPIPNRLNRINITEVQLIYEE
ncbi:hypothetical protein FW774_06315 [Pedobacter sp. BS3]|uniref:hypothetical protein n=1 Tax=Pedobacter sp. BS3 TaxID=2567937 RepID=UPI0011EEEC6E|nr:hypothetical protein [Pedobacter sp. BS3]TZF84597.1 hypothetical protein FW774_06315 [Pedobacter sp. BS3]